MSDGILADARSKLVTDLMESMGRFDAERMAGLFFDLEFKDGESVAEFVLRKAKEAKPLPKDQNQITDIIAAFRKEESTLGSGARVFQEGSDLALHDLLLLNRAFSWLFNTFMQKKSETK